MKNCKFKELIIKMFKESNERTFTKQEFGATLTYGNFFGTLYSPMSTTSFSDIRDIGKYMDTANPDMLLLYSRKTRKEIEVYSSSFIDYKINGNILTVKLENKELTFDMG